MSEVRKVPMRTCVGCREKKAKKELIRILRTPDGEIRLDFTGRQNGRGAYICADAACLAKARKNHGVERSLGCAIPPEVFDRLEEELKQNGQ
ncbi:MAG: YlxR family protein [Eubacterium sp.]|nr:YlxR family protein [Eubacterium sp.]